MMSARQQKQAIYDVISHIKEFQLYQRAKVSLQGFFKWERLGSRLETRKTEAGKQIRKSRQEMPVVWLIILAMGKKQINLRKIVFKKFNQKFNCSLIGY